MKTTPLARLGRWDGTAWASIAPAEVTAPRVHVLCHGWCPGARPAVDAAGRFLYVWDTAARTATGKRFDRWFGPLADAIVADDPEAAVLAYSWIDESATHDGRTRSVASQLRTTVNGQRLAVALRQALGGRDQALHLIGYSHGAKVATVAAALVDPTPLHLTILDSPDTLIPAIGGALNDLGSYLRVLVPDLTTDETFASELVDTPAVAFIDNYVSHFGTQYGALHGLGAIVDVTLAPEAHPLDDAPSPHGYAWAWYLATARDPSLGVGYAWSPLRSAPTTPAARELRQADRPFTLERNAEVASAGVGARLRSRIGARVEATTTLTPARRRSYEVFWRRAGDLWASVPVTWRSGPDDANVRVYGNRTERARSTKGWSREAQRLIHIPLGAARSGPMLVKVELWSSAPAEVEIGRAVAVNGFALPFGTERANWARSAFWAASASAVAGAAVGLRRALGR